MWLLLCHCEGKIKLLFQRLKREEELKNAAKAFPHTDFNSLVCAEMLPLDSGSVCCLEGEEKDVAPGCPFGPSATLPCVPPLLGDSHELPRLVRRHSDPGSWILFFNDYIKFPAMEWDGRGWDGK